MSAANTTTTKLASIADRANHERPTILALDQAAQSGWAVHDGKRICAYGLAHTVQQRTEVVRGAQHIALAAGRNLLVFYEDHSTIPASRKRNTATILGMGDARGRWLEQLELAGHPKAWLASVDPNTWRRKLIGGFGGTDALKQRALVRASATVSTPVDDHNVAEAICIAEWAAWDGVASFFKERELRRVRRQQAQAGRA